MRLFKNKRGVVLDLFVAIILVTVLMIVGMVGIYVTNSVFTNPSFNSTIATVGGVSGSNATAGSPVGNTTRDAVSYIRGSETTRGTIDSFIMGAYFLLHIGVIVLAALIGANLILFGLNIVVSIILILFSVLINNFVPNIMTAFGAQTFMPNTLWIFNNLPLLETIWVALLLIVMYVTQKGRV